MEQSFTPLEHSAVAARTERKKRVIRVALGEEAADMVLKNASYVNVFSNEVCFGDIAVAEGLICGVGEGYSGAEELDVSGHIVTPGFIDAHIHIESAMVTPAEFARAVAPHGTTTVVTDPHEIANVLGADGIDYMLQTSAGLPVDVRFMLPSCVPATALDESGAALSWEDIDRFYADGRVLGLAEMMNYVGAMRCDEGVLAKIAAAQARHKKIDGHAPGLSGKALCAYLAAGVYSDHECSTAAEAIEKLKLGQFVMIRDGTAAKNLDALTPLLSSRYASRCMLCTDDKHPGDLRRLGHMDYIIKRAIGLGVDPIRAIKAGTYNAARYFLMNNRGAVSPGYAADLVVLDNLADFTVERVYKNGVLSALGGACLPFETPLASARLEARARQSVHMAPVTALSFKNDRPLGLLGMVDGQIITENLGFAEHADTASDVLKIAVVERHRATGHVGLGFIKGYGLRRGAVAASISHDSHNIIAVGVSDEELCAAVRRLDETGGGLCVVEDGRVTAEVPLPIAGIISDAPLADVDDALERAKDAAWRQGAGRGIDPFMTLAFMALPVIPALRVTTEGVVDVATQSLV